MSYINAVDYYPDIKGIGEEILCNMDKTLEALY